MSAAIKRPTELCDKEEEMWRITDNGQSTNGIAHDAIPL